MHPVKKKTIKRITALNYLKKGCTSAAGKANESGILNDLATFEDDYRVPYYGSFHLYAAYPHPSYIYPHD